MTNDFILKAIQRLETQKNKIDERLKKVRSLYLIECDACSKSHKIGDITYIQTHYYEHPFSCSGGDYWCESEGQWNCPDCNKRNRLYDKKNIERMKFYFKNIEKVY